MNSRSSPERWPSWIDLLSRDLVDVRASFSIYFLRMMFSNLIWIPDLRSPEQDDRKDLIVWIFPLVIDAEHNRNFNLDSLFCVRMEL